LDNVNVMVQTTGLKWLRLAAGKEGLGQFKKLEQTTIDNRIFYKDWSLCVGG